MSLCRTINEILSLISQNLKRSSYAEHILFMNALVLLCVNQHTHFEVNIHQYQRYDWGKFLKKIGSRDPDHTHKGNLSSLVILYLHKKFGDSHFSHFRDMIAGVAVENRSCDPDHAPFRGGLSSVS